MHAVAISDETNTTKLIKRVPQLVRQVDNDGSTSLFYSADSPAIAHQLLAAGVNPYHKNKHGLTALDVARAKNKVSVVSVIELLSA